MRRSELLISRRAGVDQRGWPEIVRPDVVAALVGDVHQPLHARPGEQQRSKRRCGRKSGETGLFEMRVACVLGWPAGDHQQSECGGESREKLPKANATLAAKSDEKDWIAESFQEAQQTVYSAPIAVGDGPFTLTPRTRRQRQNSEAAVALRGAAGEFAEYGAEVRALRVVGF